MALILLTALAALAMGILFVVIGRTVVVVLFTGSVGTRPLIAAVAVRVDRAQLHPKFQRQAQTKTLQRLRIQVSSRKLARPACQLCMQVSCRMDE